MSCQVNPVEWGLSDNGTRWGIIDSYTWSYPTPSFNPDKNKGACPSPTGGSVCVGNPINIGAANKFFVESDIATNAAGLQFQRVYNSLNVSSATLIGAGWQHNYNLSLTIAGGSNPSSAFALRGDGRVLRFVQETSPSTTWFSDGDVTDQLQTLLDGSGNVTGYQFIDGKSDRVESYDTAGHLISINDSRASQTFTFAYDGSYRLTTVTDRSGRQLQFGYDSQGRISDVWQPDSNLGDPNSPHWQYGYDSSNRLTSVTTPNNTTRTYAYENANFADALTGIVDDNTHRYVTYTYDSQGRPSGENFWSAAGQTLPVNQYTISYQSGYTQVTDPLGLSRNLQFSNVQGVAVLSTVSQPCIGCGIGTVKSRSYDSSTGFTNQTTDFNGNVTNYNYDARGLDEQHVEATGATSQRTINTAWNPNFRVPNQRSVLNASSAIESLTKWAYNSRGQVLSRCEVDPNISGASSYTCGSLTNAPSGVRQTSYTYCESSDVALGTCPLVGLVLTVTSPRTDLSSVTTYTYYQTPDTSGCATLGGTCHAAGDLLQVTNALGQSTTYISYDKNGRVTRQSDANGTLTDFTYHPRGWLLTRTVRANASGSASSNDATTTFAYDNVGQVTQITQPDGAYLHYTYDVAHRLTDIIDNLNNAIHYTLDAAGNRTGETTKDPTSTLTRSLTRQYDQLNRLTKTLNATSATVQQFTNPSEAPPSGITYTDGYDGNGNAIYSVDGNGIGTEQQYDPLNRLVKTLQDHAGTGTTKNTTTQYTYDARDNLRSVTDPDSLPTSYTYDGLNNLTQLQSPDTGTSGYTYDAAGNRLTQTDARSVLTTYGYDALNRLTGITYPTSSLNVTYTYDQAAAGCFNTGRLTTITDGSGGTVYCYDRHGNVLSKQQTANGVVSTISYAYTVADRISAITYPSGAIVSYTRNTLGQITAISYQANVTASTQTLISSASYLPFGPLSQIAFGNGRTLSKTYDINYAIDKVVSSDANGLIVDATVDVLGNLTNASSTVGASTATQSYLYDPLYRLTTSQTGATPASPLESYTYGKTGDRTSAALNGGTATTYSYTTATHQLQSVGAATRSYDANGNTIAANGDTFTYDDRNRFSALNAGTMSGTQANYSYNGKGERVAKSVGIVGQPPTTTTFVYGEGGQVVGEYTGANSQEYIYLNSLPVGIAAGGQLYYVETDQLGTPRVAAQPGAATSADTIVWKWDYFGSAFGTNPPSPQALTVNLRFPGQYYDAETGLNYNYFRDYDSSTGRYIESDPIGMKGGISTYSYTANNPLGKFDPSGLAPKDKWWEFTNSDFQKWYHRCWKLEGDRDATREELADAYDAWKASGSPKNGNCGGGSPQPCPDPEPEPAPPPPVDSPSTTRIIILGLGTFLLYVLGALSGQAA